MRQPPSRLPSGLWTTGRCPFARRKAIYEKGYAGVASGLVGVEESAVGSTFDAAATAVDGRQDTLDASEGCLNRTGNAVSLGPCP